MNKMCIILMAVLIVSYIELSYQGNAPKLKPFAFERNVVAGQSVRVFCRLLEGSPPVVFRWLKDGHQLKQMASESVGVAIETHDDYSSLYIDRVSAISSGVYTCLVSNVYGSDTYSDVLVIEMPPYLRSSVSIPILVAIVIIVIACSAAYVYIKIEERNAQLIKAGMLSVSPSKNFQYIDTSMASTATPNMSGRTSVVSEEGSLAFSYHDASDKSKPLLARPGQPAMLWTHETIVEEQEENQYASLPFQKQQMATFKDPPPQLPPRPPPPENRPFAYDEKGLLCHTPPHTSSGNVFCKVDVHHNDNSDSYDEFCIRPQHV